MEKRVCRNRFLLVCTIKGLRKGSETGDKEWKEKTIRVEEDQVKENITVSGLREEKSICFLYAELTLCDLIDSLQWM